MHRKKRRINKQPIFCGRDIKDWTGYKIVDVKSNKLDLNVRVKLMNAEGHVVQIFLDNLCFDGDTLFYTERDSKPQVPRHE